MTSNNRKREVQEIIAAKRAEREKAISERKKELTREARIILLNNGINPQSNVPFTDEELKRMREKAGTPEQLRIYQRIQAGRGGMGKVFEESAIDPFCGMTIGDFREKMDEFYTGLGWS